MYKAVIVFFCPRLYLELINAITDRKAYNQESRLNAVEEVMNKNDILVRLRYALDLKDQEMVDIFKLGDLDVTKEAVQKMLAKIKTPTTNSEETEAFADNEYELACDNQTLESFLNGLIVLKRGKQEPKPGAPKKQEFMIKDQRSVNNVLFKKLKIALSLTSDDILDILDEAGVYLSNSELSAVLRKEGHRNYKECGDRYARNFLKGLTMRYRA